MCERTPVLNEGFVAWLAPDDQWWARALAKEVMSRVGMVRAVVWANTHKTVVVSCPAATNFDGYYEKFAASHLEEFAVCGFLRTPGIVDCGSGLAAYP